MKHKELRKRNWLFTANNLHAKIKFTVHVVDLTHALFPVEEVAFLTKTYSNFGNLYSYTCITICGRPIFRVLPARNPTALLALAYFGFGFHGQNIWRHDRGLIDKSLARDNVTSVPIVCSRCLSMGMPPP